MLLVSVSEKPRSLKDSCVRLNSARSSTWSMSGFSPCIQKGWCKTHSPRLWRSERPRRHVTGRNAEYTVGDAKRDRSWMKMHVKAKNRLHKHIIYWTSIAYFGTLWCLALSWYLPGVLDIHFTGQGRYVDNMAESSKQVLRKTPPNDPLSSEYGEISSGAAHF